MADLYVGPGADPEPTNLTNPGGVSFPAYFDKDFTIAFVNGGPDPNLDGPYSLYTGPQGNYGIASLHAGFVGTSIPRNWDAQVGGVFGYAIKNLNVSATEFTGGSKNFDSTTGFPGYTEYGDISIYTNVVNSLAGQAQAYDVEPITTDIDTTSPGAIPASLSENQAELLIWSFVLDDGQIFTMRHALTGTRRWGSISDTSTPSGDLYNAVWDDARALMPPLPDYDFRAENNENPWGSIWTSAFTASAYHQTTATTSGDNHYVCINEAYEARFGQTFGWSHPTIGLQTLASYTKVVSGASGSGDGAGETFGVWESNFTSAATGTIYSMAPYASINFSIQ